MNKRVYIASLLVLYLSVAAFAQQSMPPFISRLTAKVENASIRLTWQDSAESVKRYLVYRHDREITNDNFDSAVFVGTALQGEMVFIDSPPDDTPYYYLVLAADDDGDPMPVYIPFRNKTTTSAAVDADAIDAAKPVEITGLTASVSGEKVVLSYASSSTKRDVVIYRGIRPILDTEDLLDSVQVATVKSSEGEFMDEPVPGIEYYYALFDTEELRIGIHEFNLADNVMIEPVRIPSTLSTAGPIGQSTIRSKPLPFLLLSTKLETGERLTGTRSSLDITPSPLSPDAMQAIESLLPTPLQRINPFSEPVLLPGDGPVIGEDSSVIARAVTPLFESEDWNGARNALESFIRTRRADETIHRARFYIGQTYYFEARYREAFIQFLYASESYYSESQPWMDSVLFLLRSSE